LNVGQEGIFFLQADPANAFCRQIEYALPISRLDFQFEDARKLIATLVKVYAAPTTALSADKLCDRRFAAVALVARYRAGRPTVGAKTAEADEPIPAEESRLILDILGGMKWSDQPLEPTGVMSLRSAFSQLQLSEKDGWLDFKPKENEDPDEAMGKAVADWFKNHAGKYRIQRRVVREIDAKPIR
jgi:hypothetical protein